MSTNCVEKGESEFDKEDMARCTDIYIFLVPSMLNVLEKALICYEILDKDRKDVQQGGITYTHLQIVNNVIATLLQLIHSASKYNPRPPANLHIVEPVRNGINPRLREVHQFFSKVIYRHEADLAHQARREEGARQAALRLEQEERRNHQEAYTTHWQDKWQKLHMERRLAEGGIPSTKKLIHLALPQYDIDHNGQRFERAEVFQPRVGPPPGLVEAASKVEWRQLELSALADGLRQYDGPLVLEKVIRKHCGRGGELNRFNVTQIATVAAILREVLMKEAEDGGVQVQTWVDKIPVWTKIQQAIGKENEDDMERIEDEEQEVDGDVEMVMDGLFVE